MSAQNKTPFDLHFLFGIILVWTSSLARSSFAGSCDELTILKIPALGRDATLGELYDERNGNFRENKVNIFRDVVPKETITTTRRPNKMTDFRIIRHDHQHTDKFNLLNVDENSAVNILAGVLEVESGASRFLTETINATEANAVLIFRQQTVTESLQIYFDALRSFYNTDLLNHNSATHIVTGILWGAQAVVSIASPVSQNESRREVENRMRSEFKASQHSQLFTNASYYSIKYWEDLESSVIIDDKIINNLSEAILTTADRKGIQLEYTLMPLCKIRELLKKPNLGEVTVNKLDYWTLQGIIETFDQIVSTRQKLVSLENILELYSACLSHESRTNFLSIQNGFTKLLEEFLVKLEEGVVTVRSGNKEQTYLNVVLDDYNEDRFGTKNVELLIAEFSGTLKKIDFYTYVQTNVKNVQYIGAFDNLNIGAKSVSDWTATDNLPKGSAASTRMYLLYYKHAWTVEKVDAWLESSQVFFGNLQKDASSNSWDFYVIDCDFGHLHCGNISQPTIHEYTNGKLTSSNYVVTVEETESLNAALVQFTEARNHSEALCISKHACLNGGKFIPAVGDEDFLCSCKRGYSGNKCETMIDNCDSNPCQNSGWCQNRVNSYTCKCQIGFTGESCALPVDWCALEEAPCKHGGTCRNKQLGFTCDCISPWFGQSCENQFDPCTLVTCMNRATCKPVNNVLGYVCQCRDGFNGPFCEIDIDDCVSNTQACLNGGSCVDQVNRFKCTCPAGFNGQLCEKDIDECALKSNRCLNGGSCADEINGFKCTCLAGFNGQFCESSECTALPAEFLGTHSGLKPMSLNCGGVIPFPSNKRYHLFTFQPSQINSTNNRCLWSFKDVNTGRWFNTNLKVTLICSRFSQTKSHLSLHYYSPNFSNENLQTLKLINSAKVMDLTGEESNGHFLSFFSEETEESVTFTILVDAVHRGGSRNSVHSYKEVSGSQAFGPFSKYTIFSMTVNPAKARTTLSLDLFRTGKNDACSWADTLDIYEISGKDEPRRLDRFCNSLTSPVSFTSEYPVLILHYAYNYYSSTTFKISWT